MHNITLLIHISYSIRKIKTEILSASDVSQFNYKSKAILLFSKMANSDQEEIYRLNKKIKELLAFSEKSKLQVVINCALRIMANFK